MGAGNSANKLQRVSSLLSKHAKSKRIAEILYRLAQKTQPNYAIELGTSLGMSTCYITAGALAEKNTAFKMHTIEGAPDIADIAKEGFHKIGLNQNIQSHVGHFDEVLPEILQTIPSIDLAYIDGNHQEEPTIRYFEMLLSKSHHHTILIFDDIHWSSGMTKAWNYIQNHPQVSVTVDLFFIGLVFLHSGQAKEHFKLRIW
jgi:predicted O-methyltransferase YrrM